MAEWRECSLESVCSRLSSGKGISAKLISESGGYPVYGGNGIRGYTDTSNFKGECAIVGRQGAYCGNVRYFRGEAYMTEHAVVVCANEDNCTRYLAYLLATMNLGRLSAQSAQPGLSVKTFRKQEIRMPDKKVQLKCAELLGSLDEKISHNEEVNKNLEQQAQAIFSNEFLTLETPPDGWKQASLIDIADYLNGLAMQKYRPTASETGIPVLKIKELRQGCCDDNSELCSPNIKSEYIIHDGDVIFSWSGSLLVDFWCGGICGLNQHLFKVTSNKHDKWFYYIWTKHHLDRFIAVAADKATTMGHIKRDELSKAEVLIPNKADYKRIGALLKPIYDLIIANRIENQKLAETRDTLLPKLMSGEIDISEVDYE